MTRWTMTAMVCALTLAGCGDGGGERLTREQLIAAGDEICARGNAEIDANFGNWPGDDADVEAMAAFFTDEILPAVRSIHDGLDELRPPKADEERFERLTNDLRSAIREAERLIADEPERVFAGAGIDPFETVDAAARGFGFEVCGRDR